MTPPVGEQRRGRKIAMTTAELDGFLAGQRTCRVATVGTLFARKYAGGDFMDHDGRHAWLRLVPDTITSWDFRKIKHSERTGAAPGDSGSSPA